jgi:hypothetical protein
MVNICFAGKYLHNLFDMGISQDIVIGLFFEQFAGVNKLNVGIGFMFDNTRMFTAMVVPKNRFGAREITVST